jgi:hypothetical protein
VNEYQFILADVIVSQTFSNQIEFVVILKESVLLAIGNITLEKLILVSVTIAVGDTNSPHFLIISADNIIFLKSLLVANDIFQIFKFSFKIS